MKGLVDKSIGIVTHIAEALARIKPTETSRFVVYYKSRKRELKAKLMNESVR